MDLTARSLAKAGRKQAGGLITGKQARGGGVVFMAEYATADKNNPTSCSSTSLLINNLKKKE